MGLCATAHCHVCCPCVLPMKFANVFCQCMFQGSVPQLATSTNWCGAVQDLRPVLAGAWDVVGCCGGIQAIVGIVCCGFAARCVSHEFSKEHTMQCAHPVLNTEESVAGYEGHGHHLLCLKHSCADCMLHAEPTFGGR